jgi:site-specific recombinase XerD
METKEQDNQREFDTYILYLQNVRSLALHTVASYRCDLEKLNLFLRSRELGVYEVTHEDARRFSGALMQRAYATATINRMLAAVRGFYTYAYKTGKCQLNPFSRISGTSRHRRLPSVLSKDEVHRILSQPYTDFLGLRDLMLFHLFYSTGCRLSELLTADLKDVELEQSRMLVMGKGSKERYVFLNPRTEELLKTYLPQRAGWQTCNGIKDGDDLQALLVNHSGKRLSASSVHSIFRKYQLKLGIQKQFTPHVFRHSFATHMLDNDSGIRIVQELLGHSSISTTQIYSHVPTLSPWRKLLRRISSSIMEILHVRRWRWLRNGGWIAICVDWKL